MEGASQLSQCVINVTDETNCRNCNTNRTTEGYECYNLLDVISDSSNCLYEVHSRYIGFFLPLVNVANIFYVPKVTVNTSWLYNVYICNCCYI